MLRKLEFEYVEAPCRKCFISAITAAGGESSNWSLRRSMRSSLSRRPD
jgi:hypothetical protein